MRSLHQLVWRRDPKLGIRKNKLKGKLSHSKMSCLNWWTYNEKIHYKPLMIEHLPRWKTHLD
jgi:hypothetical protein